MVNELIDGDENVDRPFRHFLFGDVVVNEALHEGAPDEGEDGDERHDDLLVSRNLKQQGPLVLRHVRHELVKLAGHRKSSSIFIDKKVNWLMVY